MNANRTTTIIAKFYQGKPVRSITVLILITIHFCLGFGSLIQKAPTADEYTYISTGYLYLQTGDYRLDQTHPPLIRFLIGVPLQFLQIQLPPLRVDDLWGTDTSYILGYPIGWEMLLSGKNDWQTILMWARLPILLLSCLLAWLIYAWASKVYGIAGGFISLSLYALSPNMLAHARLATLDLGISFFFILTLYLLFLLYEKQTLWLVFAVGVALGCALASKVTAFLLLPALLLYMFYSQNTVSPKKLFFNVGIIILTSLLVLLLVYQWPLKPFLYGNTLSNVLTKSLQLQDPQANIPGMPHQQHAFYLMGNYSTSGWAHYFIIALFLKTPLAVLMGIVVGLIFCTKRWFGFFDALIVGTIALLLLSSVFNKVNIGIRHILPFFPLIHLYLGRLWQLHGAPYGKWILIFLSVVYLNAAFIAYPHYIAYFNEIAGGAENGHAYLDDSNLDWGQDLHLLKQVQEQYPDSPLYVATNWIFHGQPFGVNAQLLSKEQIADPPKGIIVVGKHWALRHQISKSSPYYFDWLSRNPPVGNLGHSMWIFDFRE